jgi:hypothetical protein
MFIHLAIRDFRTASKRIAPSMLPNLRRPLALVVEASTNLSAVELVAFVEAVDSVESAHDGLKLEVHSAIFIRFVDVDALDGAELKER